MQTPDHIARAAKVIADFNACGHCEGTCSTCRGEAEALADAGLLATDRRRGTMKIILTEDNGVEHDITDSIPFMYDAIIQSLDWGSGFLDLEDKLHIAYVGALAGYEVPEVVSMDDCPRPRLHDYTANIGTSNWAGREHEVARAKHAEDTRAWEVAYSQRAPDLIFKALKRFEMDEDN